MEKEITIIMCCYNSEQYLHNTLNKVFAQQNIKKYLQEVIIVDNHSTDSTKNIIFQFIEKTLPIPLRYAYEGKPGLSNARKKGVDLCTTKWIAFLDDDNFIEPNWIENIAQYIETNKKIGVLNGAVIPYVSFQMSKKENQRLQASLKVLACTHYDIEKVKNHPCSPFRNPIGAGMVILAEPLKNLSSNGWLHSSGRTKDNLSSGEDGEMAFYVKNQGYEFGFCPKAILYHAINRNRLKDTYLKKIWFEAGYGVAGVIKNKDIGKIKSLGYEMLIQCRRVLYSLQNGYKGKYYRHYISGYHTGIKTKRGKR